MARAPAKTSKPKEETPKDDAEEVLQTGPSDRWVWISCHSPRRRAGLSFGPTPTRVDLSALDEEQLEALKSDLKLVIRPVEDDTKE